MTFNFDRELVACMPELERYARRLAHNAAQAEDLVQSCLERALRNRDRFEPGSNMPAWLCTILKNLHFTNCKRARRINETEVTEGMIVAGPAQEWQIMLRETGEALERLKPSQRRLIRTVAIEGECYQDAANMLNVSIGTVRSRLSRARAELRQAGTGGTPREGSRVPAPAQAGEAARATRPPSSNRAAHPRRPSARPAPRRSEGRRPADAPAVPLLPKRTVDGHAGPLAATVSLCVAWSPAPAGGTVPLAGTDCFDTLNPFTVHGVAASGLSGLRDTLMAPSLDEPFSRSPLVAESVRVAEDLSWVEYSLNPAARFPDGRPVMPEDVIFTFRTLRDTHPIYATCYAGVSEVRSTGRRSMRFDLKPGDNRELPVNRVPVNRGRHAFNTITYGYYLAPTVALTAFKGGLVDFRIGSTAKDWATAHNMAEAGAAVLGRVLLWGHCAIPVGIPAWCAWPVGTSWNLRGTCLPSASRSMPGGWSPPQRPLAMQGRIPLVGRPCASPPRTVEI